MISFSVTRFIPEILVTNRTLALPVKEELEIFGNKFGRKSIFMVLQQLCSALKKQDREVL